jgi:hypothetical protein
MEADRIFFGRGMMMSREKVSRRAEGSVDYI